MYDLFPFFLQILAASVEFFRQATWGDIFGLLTGVICVWLTARANIWNFPVGILNCLILGVMFFERRLFADASLQIVFILLAIQGWWQWLKGHYAKEDSPVFRTPRSLSLRLLFISLAFSLMLWRLLIWLNGSAPFLDALITSMSLCAQWQLNRRMLESWAWWIAVDLVSIPLYWHRDLPFISMLYVVFLGLCISGVWRWRKLSSPIRIEKEV